MNPTTQARALIALALIVLLLGIVGHIEYSDMRSMSAADSTAQFDPAQYSN